MTQAGTKDHPITIEPIAERVRVIWRGRTIGDSNARSSCARRATSPSSTCRATTST